MFPERRTNPLRVLKRDQQPELLLSFNMRPIILNRRSTANCKIASLRRVIVLALPLIFSEPLEQGTLCKNCVHWLQVPQ